MYKPWYSYLFVRSPIAKIAWGIAGVLVAIVVILFLGLVEENRMQAQEANWNGRSIEQGAALYVNNCASCHGLEGQGGAGPALKSRYFFEHRLTDIGFTGTLHDYVELTVAAGRPSKVNVQWAVMMPTWSTRFGGPMREDQVEHVTRYVLNWEQAALQQTPDQDPWIAFQDAPRTTATGEVVTPEAAGVPAEGDEPRAPQDIFVSLGCAGCHNLNEPQTDTNRGPVGPHLGNLHETAPTRVPGEDAVTYVHNSIVAPNAFIVPGYSANIMPANLDARMTDEELDLLVAWLLDPNRPQ
jgi:mono/diheme cytochrome c family protein